MPVPRASGGIGRRAGFRFLWAISPWGFKSPLAHELLSQRNRPRRLRLLVPVLLTVAVAGVVAIITLGSRSPAQSLYAEDLRDIAVEAGRASMVFQDLLARATTVDRAELTSVVDEVEDLLETVNGSQPPAEVGPEARALWSLLNSASAAWLEGVAGFETALLRAADDPAAVAIQDSLTASLATLGSGDRIYAAFLDAATDPTLTQPVSGYPPVRFLPAGFPLAATVDALVAYARAPLSPLRLRANVVIDTDRRPSPRCRGAASGTSRERRCCWSSPSCASRWSGWSAAGFTPMVPPVLVREQALFGTGFFPGDREQVYEVPRTTCSWSVPPRCRWRPITPTRSSTPTTSPSATPGSRPASGGRPGTYGKDTAGIFRVHQFDKVEMFVFTHPEDSQDEHERLLEIEESLVGALEVPYRVVNVAAGDLGASAAKKYDIEAWFPGQQAYREITSCSNTTDFQARRLKVRYRSDRRATGRPHPQRHRGGGRSHDPGDPREPPAGRRLGGDSRRRSALHRLRRHLAGSVSAESDPIFARIARRYDLINRILSFGQEQNWRKRAVAPTSPGTCARPGQRHRSRRPGVFADREVVALDPVVEMLRSAPSPMRVVGVGEALPFADESFDGVFSAYVFRNLTSVPDTLEEIERVLRPGGERR
jgi:hypothetical protein